MVNVPPPILDAGIFILLIAIGVVCWFAAKNVGGLVYAGSVICFLIVGIAILSGYDVASFTVAESGSDMTNQTTYFMGNGISPPANVGENLALGYVFVILAIISGIIMLFSAARGELIKG